MSKEQELRIAELEAELETERNIFKQMNNIDEKDDRIAELEANTAQDEVYLSELRDRVRELEAELAKCPWISAENPPEYYKDSQYSVSILILNGRQVVIGNYIEGKYEWWSGSYRNTDDKGGQKTITHWMPKPTLPEPKEQDNGTKKKQ